MANSLRNKVIGLESRYSLDIAVLVFSIIENKLPYLNKLIGVTLLGVDNFFIIVHHTVIFNDVIAFISSKKTV